MYQSIPFSFRFVMNTHVKCRTIYLTRHGETEYNIKKLIGGDSLLTERGLLYSDKLKEYFTSFVDKYHSDRSVPHISLVASSNQTLRYGAVH